VVNRIDGADKLLGQRLEARTNIPVPESHDEPAPSMSSRLAEYSRGMREYQQQVAEQREAEATAAAKPKPETLLESLKVALAASNADNETPGLNDIRILEAAAGGSLPRSTRESVADILRQVWDSKA
jgi:hypothetical protein